VRNLLDYGKLNGASNRPNKVCSESLNEMYGSTRSEKSKSAIAAKPGKTEDYFKRLSDLINPG